MEYIAAEAESPIEKGDFLSFTKREAEIYFNWYIEHIDERIEYLCEYVHSQGQSIELDFSVNSIIEIWDWYVKQIKIERYTRSELEEIAKEYNVSSVYVDTALWQYCAEKKFEMWPSILLKFFGDKMKMIFHGGFLQNRKNSIRLMSRFY